MFLKECKKLVRSFLFWLFTAAIVLVYLTQFVPELKTKLAKPTEENTSYGAIVTKDPNVIMPAAVQNLLEEYLKGYYTAYPLMLYKKVYLKEEDTIRMAEILEELTGLTKKELDFFNAYEPAGYEYEDVDGSQIAKYHEAVLPDYMLSEVSYERFLVLMDQADDLIGGGSSYEEKKLIRKFSTVPMDYAAALEEYRAIMTNEEIGKAYVRLFCDYMGIFLAVLPVFAAVAFWDMDRRNGTEAVIYNRKASSAKIVGIRYAALVFCMALPLLLTLLHMAVCLNGLYPELDIMWRNGFLLAAVWLLPELMTVIALGVVVTELVSPLAAIFLQGIWWYISMGQNELTGTITKWSLVLRHNNLTGLRLFQEEYRTLLWNRSFYLILAFAFVSAEVFLFHRKRRGTFFNTGRIIPNCGKKANIRFGRNKKASK